MFKLPFKTSPKKNKVIVGNPEIGEIELPKFLDLSANERIFIKEKTKHLGDLQSSAVKLARNIATKSQIRILDVYNALTSGDSETLADHLEEFVEFQQQMEETAQKRAIVMATALIKHRLNIESTEEDEWDVHHTGNPELIHPGLVQELAEFARNEENGWKKAQSSELTEEDLGKSNPEETTNQTGEKSSGELETTGQTTTDLTNVTLDASQPG